MPYIDRGPQHLDRRLGRHRHRAAGRHLRRRADPQRRSRALFGQGRRPRHLLLLRAGNAQRGAGPADPRERPARRRSAAASSSSSTSRWSTPRPRSSSGFEALVRWHHPDPRRDLAEPVHPARRGKRPDPADRRMGAAHRLPRKRRNGPSNIRVAVNLSPIQFVDPSLPAIVRQRARQFADCRRASSSSRSPRACSWSKANRPTTCSPS